MLVSCRDSMIDNRFEDGRHASKYRAEPAGKIEPGGAQRNPQRNSRSHEPSP